MRNESKEGHDKQVKGRSKKVINVEEITIQEKKEEIVEESYCTFKTSRINGNVKQGNNDKDKIFTVNIKWKISWEIMDEKHTLSNGQKMRMLKPRKPIIKKDWENLPLQ